MAVNLLFAAVQDASDDIVPDETVEEVQERPPTPGGSVIGIPGYAYDRRPHIIEEVEKLRLEQVAAQEAGDYKQVEILNDRIMELDAPEEYAVVQKARAEGEAARAEQHQ